MTAAAQPQHTCEFLPSDNDPSGACKAAIAIDGRCLAHLPADARASWLAGLVPGSDIDMRGVTFTEELLTNLLEALKNPRGRPEIGGANFTDAKFVEDVAFFHDSTFAGQASFIRARFDGDAQFRGTVFSNGASFDGATFTKNTIFSATIFSGDIRFTGATFNNTTEFRGAVFNDSVTCARATFKGNTKVRNSTFLRIAEFIDCTFSQDTGFETSTFQGDATFNDVTFDRACSFTDVSFNENASFVRSIFNELFEFNRVTFNDGAFFFNARFHGSVKFNKVTFSGEAGFSRATFDGGASFDNTTFSGDTDFNSVTIDQEVRIEGSARQVHMRMARGSASVIFRLSGAEMDLTDTVLQGSMSVHGFSRDLSNTIEKALNSKYSRRPEVRVISLRRMDVASITLTDVDLSQCRFAGLKRTDQIVLDGKCVFAEGPGRRRQALAEELHWRAVRDAVPVDQRRRRGKLSLLPAIDGEGYPVDREMVGPARLEVLYRQLRKALEDAKNEPGAADFYYGEMEMRRAAATRRAERWLLGLYWAASGYGLRARRAAAWLALLIVLSIGGLTWFGFPQTVKSQVAKGAVVTESGRQPITLNIRQSDPVRPLPDRIEKAAEITLNAVIFRSPDADLTTAGRYLNIATRILGPVLLGLSVLAIRNQVKR